MKDGLSLGQIVMLLAYAIGMAGGQILFKLASPQFAGDRPLLNRAISVLQNGYFLSALVLYGVLTVLWVWILSFTPLSRAYPFVALAFVITPLFGGVLFMEPLSARLAVGIGFILFGLLVVAW